MAAPPESDASGSNNNGSTTAVHSNDITATHQESCLWPNALQVIVALFLYRIFHPFSVSLDKMMKTVHIRTGVFIYLMVAGVQCTNTKRAKSLRSEAVGSLSAVCYRINLQNTRTHTSSTNKVSVFFLFGSIW